MCDSGMDPGPRKKKIAMKGITEAMTKFENGLWIR